MLPLSEEEILQRLTLKQRKAEPETLENKKIEAQLDKMKYRRWMILGEEYQALPTKHTPNPKFFEQWEGIFQQYMDRKMTEAEFLEFDELFEDASRGWGIKNFMNDLKEKEVR